MQQSRAALPVVEVGQPFLWYWDAYPVKDGWEYLDHAGRKRDLIRYQCTDGGWNVEVRVLEFRQYLAAASRSAIVKVDLIRYADEAGFERVDDSFRNEWSHLDFSAFADRTMGRPSLSRVVGQYILAGRRGPRVPRFEDRDEVVEYPSFIYGIDPETHDTLKHTCNPEELGTYFDPDGSRLHYLTPVYFDRKVLEPYVAQPTTYRITATRLSCLNLWGSDIGFNTAGLVEVYLGDLGQNFPPEELGHWLTHNVIPEGNMEEGRFRRDFLGQWADSRDLAGDLRRARTKAARTSEKLLGTTIWRDLPTDTLAEWESMIGPLNEDPVSLGKSLLLLPITMIDAIDPTPLKAYLSGAESGEKSLSLLQRFAEKLGDVNNSTAILRHLWDFRSKGGVAHLAGSNAKKARVNLGIDGMTNLQAFESVVQRITDMLETLVALMEKRLSADDAQHTE
ncbi:MAG: hypothetical protein R2687_02220 [Candidatus Nanopelagicales bacterium]